MCELARQGTGWTSADWMPFIHSLGLDDAPRVQLQNFKLLCRERLHITVSEMPDDQLQATFETLLPKNCASFAPERLIAFVELSALEAPAVLLNNEVLNRRKEPMISLSAYLIEASRLQAELRLLLALEEEVASPDGSSEHRWPHGETSGRGGHGHYEPRLGRRLGDVPPPPISKDPQNVPTAPEAATRIQSLFRGFSSRCSLSAQGVPVMNPADLLARRLAALKARSALERKIYRAMRGHKSKKDIALYLKANFINPDSWIKTKHKRHGRRLNAVLLIQKWWRGTVVRRYFRALALHQHHEHSGRFADPERQPKIEAAKRAKALCQITLHKLAKLHRALNDAALSHSSFGEEWWLRLFRLLDTNHDRVLDLPEFLLACRQVLHLSSTEFSDGMLRNLFSLLDDGSSQSRMNKGQLDPEEFINFIRLPLHELPLFLELGAAEFRKKKYGRSKRPAAREQPKQREAAKRLTLDRLLFVHRKLRNAAYRNDVRLFAPEKLFAKLDANHDGHVDR
jgi:hypothetical protein